MIYLYLVTKTGLDKKSFHAVDQVMAHIRGRSDVLGYRCIEVPSPKRKKKEIDEQAFSQERR